MENLSGPEETTDQNKELHRPPRGRLSLDQTTTDKGTGRAELMAMEATWEMLCGSSTFDSRLLLPGGDSEASTAWDKGAKSST